VQNAHQALILIDNGKRPDVIFQDQRERLFQCGTIGDGNYCRFHAFFYHHFSSPFPECLLRTIHPIAPGRFPDQQLRLQDDSLFGEGLAIRARSILVICRAIS
jgi:hypothetical protein